MKTQKKSWIQSLFAYAEGEKKKMLLSVVLSVVSVTVGLAPFYCMYRIICLFVEGGADTAGITGWCLWALLAYGVKIVTFTLSTGVSHSMAYHVLEGLRLRLADRFLHAPLGDVENHTIGEIKSMMVDKIENLEPPLAHMIPEGRGSCGTADCEHCRASVHRLAAGAGLAGDVSVVRGLHDADDGHQRQKFPDL